MTPERWQRIKSLFSAALEVPEGERPALLALEANGDASLIDEVVSLLASHAATGKFLESPVPEMSASVYAALDDHIGERIGAYRIVGTLGTGGMGDVFRAVRDDDQYRAEVAIKLMRADVRDNLAEQRFKNERQILAKLDHRNIARLLDGGATPGGVPYVVMELVQGEPIDKYCDSHDLSVRDRVQLFLQVCSAVSYAHQHLVVHRDLKPNNILVTADGSVKLLDFGIAKLLEANPITGTTSDETRTQLRAMTIDYASPEQVSGGTVTTVSDVYSLGVVLYRLLTGQSPYGNRTNDAQRVAEILSDNAPTRPSQLKLGERRARDIDADLDDILLMALRKEPQKRYGSVEQFANDLRNFLGGLPVAARGNAWRYRLGKFVRRRKFEIAAAGIVVVSLVGGLGFAVREARIADQQRVIAQRHFNSVRKLANKLLFDINDEIEKTPGATGAREILLKTSVEYLDTLYEEGSSDRTLREELGMAYKKVAEMQSSIYHSHTGDTKGALESYSRAIALLAPLYTEESPPSLAGAYLADAYIQYSQLLANVGSRAESLESAQRGVLMTVAMQSAIADEQRRAASLAEAYYAEAYAYSAVNRPADAIASADKMVLVIEEIAKLHPTAPKLLRALTNVYNNAATFSSADDSREANFARKHGFLVKSLAAFENYFALYPDDDEWRRYYGHAQYNMAETYLSNQDYTQALRYFEDAGKTLDATYTDPNDAQGFYVLGMTRSQHARCLYKAGRTDEAAAMYARSASALDKIPASQDDYLVDFARALLNLGVGGIAADRGLNASAGSPDRQRVLEDAREKLQSGIALTRKGEAKSSLDNDSRVILDEALAKLARVEAALAQPSP